MLFVYSSTESVLHPFLHSSILVATSYAVLYYTDMERHVKCTSTALGRKYTGVTGMVQVPFGVVHCTIHVQQVRDKRSLAVTLHRQGDVVFGPSDVYVYIEQPLARGPRQPMRMLYVPRPRNHKDAGAARRSRHQMGLHCSGRRVQANQVTSSFMLT